MEYHFFCSKCILISVDRSLEEIKKMAKYENLPREITFGNIKLLDATISPSEITKLDKEGKRLNYTIRARAFFCLLHEREFEHIKFGTEYACTECEEVEKNESKENQKCYGKEKKTHQV